MCYVLYWFVSLIWTCWISNICFDFFLCGCRKTTTNIRFSTCPNWWDSEVLSRVVQFLLSTLFREYLFRIIHDWIFKHTSMRDSAKDSRCSNCSFWATSLCRWLYHDTKLGLLKNRRYKPSQSPLTLDVSCGPQLSNEVRNSAWLNGFTLGAAR